MSDGKNLVLLAAPDGPLSGARDALRDLSALGLISEFLWVRLAASGDQLAIAADKINNGSAYPVVLQQLLSERQYDRVRVCCLTSVLPTRAEPTPSRTEFTPSRTEPITPSRTELVEVPSPMPPSRPGPASRPAHPEPTSPTRPELAEGLWSTTEDAEHDLVDLVRRSAGTTKIERLRCVITRPGGSARPEDLARDGWHTVVISPEDARGPGLGHQVLEPTDDPVLLGGPAATALAGLTGLWTGLPDAPLDDLAVPPGRAVRVGRSFYRSLDASAVEQSIRDGVTSVAGGLPAVRTGGVESLRLGGPSGASNGRMDDVDAATGTMADALWRKHAAVLRGPRVKAMPSPVKDVGALAALRMLFSFIWAAIKNTPMRWRAALTNKIASTTAAAVHGGVFGRAPSAYAVVVRGIRPDGTGADWRDWAQASAELAGAIGESPSGSGGPDPSSAGRHDFSALWQDYLAGAFTLADGGDRIAELPPIQVGADRAILADPADVVPGPECRWKVPGQFAGDQPALAPYDVLGVQAAQTRLNPPEGQLTPELDRARAGLEGWFGRFRSAYATKVGGRLGRAVSEARNETQAILSSLAQAGTEDEPSDDLRRKMKRLTWWMRGLLIGLAAVIVILLVLGGFEALTVETVTISIIAAVVVWLIGSFAVFFVSQRELFRELNRRREAASQADANRVNLGHALRDLNRLSAAYEQFLAWSRIAGVVIARPFGGGAAETGSITPTRPELVEGLPANGLPLSARIGVAELRPDAVARAAAMIRREVFRAGWLSRPWRALLDSAPGRLGPEAIDLAQNPDRMFAEQAGPDSPLVRWAELLESGDGMSLNDGGRALWQAVGRSLPDSELGRSLVESVRLAGSSPDARPYAEFMAGLDQPPDSWPPDNWNAQQFDPVAFGAEARVAGRQRVDQHWYRVTGIELSRAAVLVQLSEAFAAYELAAVPGAQAGRTGAKEPWPVPEVDEVF